MIVESSQSLIVAKESVLVLSTGLCLFQASPADQNPAPLEMGIPLGRGSLRLCCACVLLFCCFSPSGSAPLQAGYVFNGNKEFANIVGPTAYKRVSTTYLVASPNDQYTLAFTIETSKTTGPVCYLEVKRFYGTPSNYSSPRAGQTWTPWTHPCPRSPLPNGNCSFEFTAQGDIRLMNSVAGILWSSNSTGLGATTLDMLDYDLADDDRRGVLALYNSTGDAVWMNAQNDTGWFQCHLSEDNSPPQASHAVKRSGAAATSLVLALGVLFLCRGRFLVFIVCCLLLASPSQCVPIQAGFTANLTSDYTAGVNESDSSLIATWWTLPLVVSPANRTDLALIVRFTKNWGRSCYLEVLADTRSTDIIRNTSTAPAPSPEDVNTFEYVPWSAPCPRKVLPNGNCTLSFTKDGDIQLLNGVAGGYTVVWSSNTSGLGATTLDVLDSDPTGSGSLILLNAQNQVVWSNVRNMTSSDFQCKNPKVASAAALASTPHLLSLLLFSNAILLLKFLV